MKLFKYLIFIFLSLFSVSIFAATQYHIHGSSYLFNSPQAACSAYGGGSYTSYTYPGWDAVVGTCGTAWVLQTESTCTADGSSTLAGNVSITARVGSSEYLALVDVATSKFSGTYVCTGGCRYNYSNLSGDGDANAPAGTLVTDNYKGRYLKTAQECSSGSTAPNDSLVADGGNDPNDPNDPTDPNGQGDGSCNGTNNCNVTNNNLDADSIISAINSSASSIMGSISSAVSSITSSISNAASSITNSVNGVSSKLDSTNSKLDSANARLNDINSNTASTASSSSQTAANTAAANAKLDQVNNKLTQTNSLLDTMKNIVNDLKTAVNTVSSKLDTTNDKLTSIESAQQSTNQKLDTANQNLDDIKTGQQATNTKLDSVNSGIDQINNKLDTANQKLESVDQGVKDTNSKLKDINDWLKDDTGTDFNESGSVTASQHELGNYESNYIQWSSSCPPDKNINISLMRQSSVLTLSWSPWCQLLAEIRWAIIACAYFAAAYIILGMR